MAVSDLFQEEPSPIHTVGRAIFADGMVNTMTKLPSSSHKASPNWVRVGWYGEPDDATLKS